MNKKILVLILIFFVLISCSNEEKDWQKTESENTLQAYKYFLSKYYKGLDESEEVQYFVEAKTRDTIRAYEDFLNRFSQGKLAENARKRIEFFVNGRLPEFRNVRTAKFVIKESFPNGVKFSDEHFVKILLKSVGLEILSDEVKMPDIVLNIQAKGEALSASYVDAGESYFGGTRYTGAKVGGVISLKHKDGFVLSKTFFGHKEPPGLISESEGRSPSGAPFKKAGEKEGSFDHKLAEIFTEAFGFNILSSLIECRKDKSLDYGDRDEMVSAAVKVLSEIKEERAIELLIAALDFSYLSVNALEKIGNLAVGLLISVLEDKNGNKLVKERAILVLGKIKDRQAVEPLIATLKDKEWKVRRAAIGSLGGMRDSRAVEPLIAIL
ncbi:MAG: HEAT repeat domain-containing protein, partial [Deltaproteobacteria bacterium]